MRGFILSFIISLLLLGSSCRKDELPDVSIRFENIMVDHYVFPYGLMFGEAVYLGSLGFQETTPYMETIGGSHSILARRVDGEWIEISEGKFNVLPGQKYTILIYGTIEQFSFQLNED